MGEENFIYPEWVNLNETVTVEKGKKVPRFGRRRQRAFRAMGDKAPFEPDGSLFDRQNPLAVIMPTNVSRVRGEVTVTATGRVLVHPDQVVLADMLEAGAYSD